MLDEKPAASDMRQLFVDDGRAAEEYKVFVGQRLEHNGCRPSSASKKSSLNSPRIDTL